MHTRSPVHRGVPAVASDSDVRRWTWAYHKDPASEFEHKNVELVCSAQALCWGPPSCQLFPTLFPGDGNLQMTTISLCLCGYCSYGITVSLRPGYSTESVPYHIRSSDMF